MNTYLLSYDLNKRDKDYKALHDKIVELSGNIWCKPVESVYLFRSNEYPHILRDAIKTVVDKNDNFLIIEVKKNYDGWLPEDIWKYMRENLF